MAAVAKSGTPSLSTTHPASEVLRTGKRAAVAIAAGDALTILSNTTVGLASGAAANAAAVVHGFAAVAAGVGDSVTLLGRGAMMHYGAGLTAPTDFYLSGTVPGGLDTVASVGGTVPIACAWDATQIVLLPNR